MTAADLVTLQIEAYNNRDLEAKKKIPLPKKIPDFRYMRTE